MPVFRKRGKGGPDAAILKKINGKSIKYAARRDENAEEYLLGKSGRINVLDEYIVIVCDGSEVFRCRREGASAAELLSLGGVVITGVSPEGKRDTAVAYYTYYR